MLSEAVVTVMRFLSITIQKHFFPLQVVRHIHGWVAEKLQTSFSKATECLNHNTWMINCKYHNINFLH